MQGVLGYRKAEVAEVNLESKQEVQELLEVPAWCPLRIDEQILCECKKAAGGRYTPLPGNRNTQMNRFYERATLTSMQPRAGYRIYFCVDDVSHTHCNQVARRIGPWQR